MGCFIVNRAWGMRSRTIWSNLTIVVPVASNDKVFDDMLWVVVRNPVKEQVTNERTQRGGELLVGASFFVGSAMASKAAEQPTS